MSDTLSRIKEISLEVAEQHQLLFIDFVIRGEGKVKIIELFIDSETGVTADDCAVVSRAINKIIEEEDLFDGPFRFDVSSPGVNRPLIYLQQYNKHIGRLFEIEFKNGDEIEKFKGKLLQIEDDKLTFELTKETKTLGFAKIVTARVKISF